MKLTYIYHSGFAIEGDGFTIVIDYYKDSSGNYSGGVVHDRLLKCSGRLYVLASHAHPDHFNPQILEWENERQDICYVLSKDISDRRKVENKRVVWLDKGDVYKDDRLSIRAFGSTDLGISFLIEAGGKTVFHAGDLNNWHWKEESTPEEVCEAEAAFLKELGDIASYTKAVDVAIFPVDPRLGKEYMLGGRQFVDCIKTGLFVPMHFGEAYKEANAFEGYAAAGAQFFSIRHRGEWIVF